MPRIYGWSDDEFESRAQALAALIRRVWRAIARQVAAQAEQQSHVTMAVARPIVPQWVQAVDNQITGYVTNMFLDAAGNISDALNTPDELLIGDDLVEVFTNAARNRLVGIGDDVWKNVQAQITLGNQAGESIPEIAERIRNVAGVSEARSLTIARTEVHAAHEAGSHAQAEFIDPNGEKTWVATEDERTRPSHRRTDGQTVKIGESFNVGTVQLRYPGDPLGDPGETINCVVGSTEVDALLIQMAMRSRYDGNVITIKTAAGKALTVTPNHPILVARDGAIWWKAAHEIEVGDHAVCGDIRRHVSKYNEQRRPTAISEVFDLAQVLRNAKGEYFPANFHGERRMAEVHVVAEDRLLGLEVEPTPKEKLPELFFTLTDRLRSSESSAESRSLALNVSGTRPELLWGQDASSQIRVVCQCSVLLSRATGSEESVGRGAVANDDTGVTKHSSYCSARDAQRLTQHEHAFTVEVSLDEIVGVVEDHFSGHVYNLSTTSGWYTGNSIISGNCRCTTTYNFDMITTVINEPENALVAATVSKWKPEMHPRGNDGKFIKKGALSNLLSKHNPNIIDVVNAVQDLDHKQWDKMTPSQKQYVKHSVNKLPNGTKVHTNATKKLAQLSGPDNSDKKTGLPTTTEKPQPQKLLNEATAHKIPAGLKGKPGDPAKITTGVVWGKHSPGDIIVEDEHGLLRVKWNGKKYDLESKQGDGSWSVQQSMSKKEFYETHKGDGSGWVIPGASKLSNDEFAPSPTTKTELTQAVTPETIAVNSPNNPVPDTETIGTTNPGALGALNMGDVESMMTIDGKYSLTTAPDNSYSPYVLIEHKPDGTVKKYGVQSSKDINYVAGNQVWYPKKDMDQAKNDPETLSHISDVEITPEDIDAAIEVIDYSPGEIIGYTSDGQHRLKYNSFMNGVTYETKVASTGDDDTDWDTVETYESEPDIGWGAAEKFAAAHPDLKFFKPKDESSTTKESTLLSPDQYNESTVSPIEKETYLSDADNDNIMSSEAVHLLNGEGGLSQEDYDSLSVIQYASIESALKQAGKHHIDNASSALTKWNSFKNPAVATPTPTDRGHTGDVTFDPPGDGESSAFVVFDMLEYVPANPDKTILVGKDDNGDKYRLTVGEHDGKKVVLVDHWNPQQKKFLSHAQFSNEDEYNTWDIDHIKWDTPSSLPDKSAIGETESVPTPSVDELPGPETHLMGSDLSLSQGVKIRQQGYNHGVVIGLSGDGKKRIIVGPHKDSAFGQIPTYVQQVKTDSGWVNDLPLSNIAMIQKLKTTDNDYWIPDHIIQDIDPNYKSNELPTPTPSVTPPMPAPTPSSTPTVTPTPPQWKIGELKASMKSNNNIGYWSKPEKIWESFKQWQSQPGNEKYAPMDVFKALDSSLKTSKPSPFQEKMTKWAASAKGAQIVGKDGIFGTPATSTTSGGLPEFKIKNLDAIWNHMQKMNDGDILAVSNEGDMRLKIYTAPDGTKLAHKEELSHDGSWLYYSDAAGSKLKLKHLLKTEDEGPSWAKKGWQAPPPDMQNQPTIPKISSPSVPSTSHSTPSTNALPDVDAGGDISSFSDIQKKMVFDSFKSHPHTYLESEPSAVYEALTTVAKTEDLTLAQVINIVDEQGAKKVNKPNAYLFKKKIGDWLKSPSGAAYIVNEPEKITGLPEPPKFLPQYEPDKLLPSFEESSKLEYKPIKSTTEATKIWNDVTAKTAPLTSSQQSGLKTWTGGSYTTINSYLFAPNQGALSPTHANAMKNSQAGMRPVDRPVLLVRGSGFQGLGNAKNHGQLEKLVGTTWRNNAFAATSIGVNSDGVASPAFSHFPLWIEFECPPGTPMAWLDPFSQHKGEREMLLGANLHYRIVSVEKKNIPGYGMKSIARVRVVPKPEEAAE